MAGRRVLKRRRIPIWAVITVSIVIPIVVAFSAVFAVGMHVQNQEIIFQSVAVSGIDVSGMTKGEAINALNIADYTERIRNTSVTLILPDESEVIITGFDADLHHDAFIVLNEAYNIGRGQGVLPSAITHILMHFSDEKEQVDFEISLLLDREMLRHITDEIAYEYNARLDESVTIILDDRIILTRGAGHVNADPYELFLLVYNALFESFENNAPVEVEYFLTPYNTITRDILALRDEVREHAVSSEFNPETNSATASSIGVDFDIMVAAELLGNTLHGRTVEFELLFTYPEYTEDLLNSLIFRDLIGERTTHVAGAYGRVNNVRLSAEKINGYVLLPGEEFSFNRVVGRRTREAGFMSGPAIVSGQSASVLGGGVCQTASTLFASIRPSELNVTEQRVHSRPVPYLPRGWDAAIWYPSIDFRFENNTNYPLLLVMELEERYLTARVYGTIIDDFPIALTELEEY